MATIGLMIHPNEIKANNFADENVDDKIIRNSIVLAQNLHILPILGTGLFDQIKDQIEADTLSANNQSLLSDYIQPALEWWAMYELVDPLTYKITNKSIMKKSSENSNPISADEVGNLKNKFKNIAEERTQRLISYLCENSDTYTLYDNPGTGSDIIQPRKFAFETGWNLQGSPNINPNVDDPNDTRDWEI